MGDGCARIIGHHTAHMELPTSQADVWDVDGTGMQTVPDFKLSKKIRKVRLCDPAPPGALRAPISSPMSSLHRKWTPRLRVCSDEAY